MKRAPAFVAAAAVVFLSAVHASAYLINVDLLAGLSPSAKTGPAAIGEGPSAFWNTYTRDDGAGGWRTAGALTGLKLADGTTTLVDITFDNLPGAWSSGSPDPMYHQYLYPFVGAAKITISNLPPGLYDLYAYGSDGAYAALWETFSLGPETTQDLAAGNPPVWTEGVQFARFENILLQSGELVLDLRNGSIGGIPMISGFQIVAVPEPAAAALLAISCMAASRRRNRGQLKNAGGGMKAPDTL